MTKKRNRYAAALMAAVFIAANTPYVFAETGNAGNAGAVGIAGETGLSFSAEAYQKERTYSDAKKDYADNGYRQVQDKEIIIPLDVAVSDSKIEISTIQGRDALIWESDEKWYEWEVSIEEEGLYEIYVDYIPLEGTGSMIQRAVAIDGEVPFKEAHNISFYRTWKESGETRFNNMGDEVWPKQVEDYIWNQTVIKDNQGYYDSALQFYFSKGRHTIRLEYVDQPMAIGGITVKSSKILPTYQEVKAGYDIDGNASNVISFEAEVTESRSDPTIRRESSNDPSCSPSSPGNRVLNIMGAKRWRKGNQSITWKFQVPEDGLYKIEMRSIQNYEEGLPVYRQIEIDGDIPFEELRCYKFPYDRDWQRKAIGDETGEPYLFYLTHGEHELTMTVKLGPIYSIVERSMEDIMTLAGLTRQIIMITGAEPDPNFEYDLDKNIPGLVEELTYLAERMEENANVLIDISTQKPSVANNYMQISDQFRSMAEKPEIIPKALNDLENTQINLGTYLINLQSMPLAIDYFVVSSPGENPEMKIKSNFLEKMYVTAVNFFASFTKDYNSVGSTYEGEEGKVINVWIARGKEWGEILKEMADEDFTPKTGISINLNVLPSNQLASGNVNTLMLSITSGRAPDVAMGVDSNSPTEFAFRDAVVDLTQFDGFDSVYERFYPSIFTPFEYNGGIFALPETMNFTLMFYRTDLLQEIGLELPKTWDEVRGITLPKLYENSMNFNYPASETTSSNSVGTVGGNLAPLLFQHSGEYYKNNGTESGLDSPQAYKAFKEWTDLYTNYGIPAQSNFFTRMRNGDMPIGIAGYNHYMQMSTTAPELYGRWSVAPVPGTIQEDGTIDRSVGSMAGSTIMIMEQSEKKEEAWQFLDWWTSEDVQARYGRELEALLGVEARWNTANINAFNALSWDKEHLEVIQYQLANSKEQPVVLGGYFTTRHINNAWNRIVLQGQTVRDSLEQAVEDINKELRAKQEEYKYKPN